MLTTLGLFNFFLWPTDFVPGSDMNLVTVILQSIILIKYPWWFPLVWHGMVT